MLHPVNGDGPNIKIGFALGNTNLINGTDYAHGKIGGNNLSGGLIYWRSKLKNDGTTVKEAFFNVKRHTSIEHYGNAFHTYSLTWTKSKLTFAVDDITYGSIDAHLNSEVNHILFYLFFQ